jgi:hypothetical protein
VFLAIEFLSLQPPVGRVVLGNSLQIAWKGGNPTAYGSIRHAVGTTTELAIRALESRAGWFKEDAVVSCMCVLRSKSRSRKKRDPGERDEAAPWLVRNDGLGDFGNWASPSGLVVFKETQIRLGHEWVPEMNSFR